MYSWGYFLWDVCYLEKLKHRIGVRDYIFSFFFFNHQKLVLQIRIFPGRNGFLYVYVFSQNFLILYIFSLLKLFYKFVLMVFFPLILRIMPIILFYFLMRASNDMSYSIIEMMHFVLLSNANLLISVLCYFDFWTDTSRFSTTIWSMMSMTKLLRHARDMGEF